MTELTQGHSPFPWNFDNGAVIKDANGKTVGDFRYKNGKADSEFIIQTLAARVPQTMDAPDLRTKPVSMGCAATREDAESGASFDCGELDFKKLDEAIAKYESYPFAERSCWEAVLNAAKLYRTQATITDEMVERAAFKMAADYVADNMPMHKDLQKHVDAILSMKTQGKQGG